MNVRETLLLRVACTRERNCATLTKYTQHPSQLERNIDFPLEGKAAQKCAIESATDLQYSSCTPVPPEEFKEPPGFEGTGWCLAGADGLSLRTLTKFFAASKALDCSQQYQEPAMD
jgi:hypothetical protein